MKRVCRLVCVAVLVIGVVGCGRNAASPRQSKIVTTDSAEDREGKAKQDEFEKQAQEAERKALGSQHIE